MPNTFEPHNIIVTGGDGIIGSNFGRYAAESHNDNSIADPEPFPRTSVEGTFPCMGPSEGAAESVLRPFAARSIADAPNSPCHTYLDTYNPMYLSHLF